MIKLDKVSKNYGRKQALNSITLDLPRGEIIGLFGENGAGKTTLMKCILGFLKCRGEITLDGEAVTRKNIDRLSFATSEHSFFPNLTAESHGDFYRMHFERFSEKRFKALIDFFGLPYRKTLRQFSTGQKNQFEVILSLCQGADYILMDEPFAGNDVFNREDFYKVLLGILGPRETVLISTHLLEEVENFISRAVLLNRGKIVGDVTALELAEEGKSLIGYVKEIHNYKSDRVSRALDELAGGEEE